MIPIDPNPKNLNRQKITLKDFRALSFDLIVTQQHLPTTSSHMRASSIPEREQSGGRSRGLAPDPASPVYATGSLDRVCATAETGGPEAHLLVADDTPEVRNSLAKLLRTEGYEVELAANGKEAINKFDPRTTDLVLLDLDMPLTNGWEVLEQMLRLNPDQAIIIITGKPDPCRWSDVAHSGILVKKPIDVGMLLKAIRNTLNEADSCRKERIAVQKKLARHTRPLPDLFRQQPYPEGGLNE